MSTPITLLCPLLAMVLAGHSTFAATQPALANPTWSGAQFQFVLNGAPNSTYIVQQSADLQNWTPVLTNSDPQAARLISLPALGTAGFWRIARVPEPRFVHAIAVRGTVTLGGSGRIDTFDSALPGVESDVNGYYQPAFATDRATIVTTSNSLGAISIGNVSVYGTVATGPGGTATLAPNGNVGSRTWNDNPANDGRIEPGHFTDDVNVYIADAAFPSDFAFPWIPSPGTVGGVAYQYVLGNGDYRIAAINVTSMMVTGKARIHVLGTTTVGVLGTITIATNASVEWYSGGNATFGGNGVINVASLATNFSVIGLRTCVSISYSGTSRFIGTIYAPNSAVSIAGTADAIGAIVARTFTLGGTMGLHFDENLKRAGPFF